MSEDMLAERSLPRVWVARWREDPSTTVLQGPRGEAVTAGALDEATAAAAGALRAAGVARGDRVVIAATTSVELVVAHCAALRAGAVVVPVNPAYTEREAAGIVADAAPALVITDAPGVAAAARESGVRVVAPALDLPPGAPPDDLDAVDVDDPALLPYTSGTTGAPKGALLTHGNLLAGAAAVVRAWRWTRDDRLVLCLPLFHMHGLGVGLHGTLLAGASAILQDRFDVDAVLAACQDATLFFGVPTMYARLADAPGVERLSGLRLCVSGSAPLPADLHARIAERTGQVVLERYGMTETVMLTSNPYDGERRAGTVGLPLPGVQLRLATNGEIEVRGPNVFGGYWNRPDATADAFTADGWFRTGDVGELDGDGYLRIVGRAKELIITGGFNVYPREIEDVLREHPAVADAAVTGTPSPEWGEVVTAWVVPSGEFDDAALLAWAGERLAPYKRPRLLHRVAAIPRNRLGKIQRDLLHPPGGNT